MWLIPRTFVRHYICCKAYNTAQNNIACNSRQAPPHTIIIGTATPSPGNRIVQNLFLPLCAVFFYVYDHSYYKVHSCSANCWDLTAAPKTARRNLYQ